MLPEIIGHNGVAFYKKVKKTFDGCHKIGYYDNGSGACLISTIDKGLITTERALREKAKRMKINID